MKAYLIEKSGTKKVCIGIPSVSRNTDIPEPTLKRQFYGKRSEFGQTYARGGWVITRIEIVK